jgi:hypothetical protein
VLARKVMLEQGVARISALRRGWITNGQAKVRWGDRTLEGNATPDGSLTMSTGYGQKFDGRIDAQQITGQLVGYCAYNLAWRKQG